MKNSTRENIGDLKSKLKAEIKDMESILTFDNPAQSIGAFARDVTENFSGTKKNQEIIDIGISLAQEYLLPSVKVAAATALTNLFTKKVKPNMGKTLLGVGAAILLPIITKKIIRGIDGYQRKQTAKSLEKLI